MATAQKKWELQKKKDGVSSGVGTPDAGPEKTEAEGGERAVKEKEPLKLQVLTPAGEGAESVVATPTEKKEEGGVEAVREAGNNDEDRQQVEEKAGDDAVCIDSRFGIRIRVRGIELIHLDRLLKVINQPKKARPRDLRRPKPLPLLPSSNKRKSNSNNRWRDFRVWPMDGLIRWVGCFPARILVLGTVIIR